MAKGWEDITSASVSAGSGAIGAGLAAGGMPVAGAAVAAGGQVVSGLMNLFKPVPKLPGPSGAQFVAAERAEATASKAAGMEGISPAEVAALDDLTLRRNLRSTAVANAYNSVYALGPAEQEILVDRIVTQQQAEASSLRSEYLMMDEEAIRRNMQMKLASNAEAERQATNIRSMEINKEIGEMAMEREKWTNFIQGMGESAELVAGAIDMADAKEAALAKEKKDMQEKTAKNYVRPMSQAEADAQRTREIATGRPAASPNTWLPTDIKYTPFTPSMTPSERVAKETEMNDMFEYSPTYMR